MNKQNIISIDEAKFSKSSKKLLSQINETLPQENQLKLTQVQEMLCKSLGYRNLYDFKKALVVSENNLLENITIDYKKEINVRENFLDFLDDEKILKIITVLIFANNDHFDDWTKRSICLMSKILKVLVYLRDNKKIVLNTTTIIDLLNLDVILKYYKRQDLPYEIRESLKEYLMFLPGFQENAIKQTDTVLEQHGFLKTKFTEVVEKFKKIENNNFIIADSSWFYRKNNCSLLEVNKILSDIDYVEDSWLFMDDYLDWITYLNSKKKLNKIRISDLLIYVSNIISPSKKKKMSLVLHSILDNYNVASKLSEEIVCITNK